MNYCIDILTGLFGVQGLQVQDYYGNFCKRNPTDVDLPAVNYLSYILIFTSLHVLYLVVVLSPKLFSFRFLSKRSVSEAYITDFGESLLYIFYFLSGFSITGDKFPTILTAD